MYVANMMANDGFFTRKWTSYDSFVADLKEFGDSTKQAFTVIDSRTIEKQNSKLSQGKCWILSLVATSLIKSLCIALAL